MLIAEALMGIFVGILIIVVVLMLLTPLFIAAGWLTNKPGFDKPSGFHMFTFIESGQVKLIVRGETVVRAIMDTSGKYFARKSGGVNRKSSSYWKILGEEGGSQSESPLAGIIWFLRPWAWYVYSINGAVFTGIYPFQRVREYLLERTKIIRTESAGRQEGVSNISLVVDTDYSDHYRLRQFLFPIHVTGAETKDKIPLDIIAVVKAWFINPHLGAFGTDRWDHLLGNLVLDAINSVTMTLTLDEVLTATTPDEARRINDAVKNITEDELVAGIEISGLDVIERNPVLTDAQMAQIQAEGFARQEGKATRISGEARADAIRSINDANAAGGETAVETMRQEAFVRAAEAAGRAGGTVIMTPPTGASSTDPTSLAILAELKKLNQRGQ